MSNSGDRQADQVNTSNNRQGLKRRDVLSGSTMLAASALIGEAAVLAAGAPASAQTTTGVALSALSSDLIGDIATSAYIYAYPLIIMEMARRVSTNVAER